jgi:putative transposase
MPKRKRYFTDVTAAEWRLLAPLLPPPPPTGRPREHEWREILNAIFYVVRGGIAWRLLPHDLPPWKTVYHYFRQWRKDSTWERWHTALREKVRRKAGREATPSAAILDSQSVKSAEGGQAIGYDAGKQVHGRKRHLVVDTLGLVLMLVVTSASLPDREGAKWVLQKLFERGMARLVMIWADSAYGGELIAWVKEKFGWVWVIIKKLEGQVGFQVLPKRWMVERTFGWLTRCRRLSRDYERLPETSEAFIYVAMLRLMTRRLATEKGF